MALNDGFTYRLHVTDDAAGATLAALLATRFPHSTAEAWRARIAGGELDLDGRPAHGDPAISIGQVVTWRRPPWDEPDVPRQFEVIHDDAAILAVSKPSGLPTMPAGGFLEHTLLALVRGQFGDVHPLHRLGRGTSGLVLFARTAAAASALGRAWRAHAIGKDYRALVVGVPAWTSQPIDTPIGPVPHDTLGTVFGAAPDGRAAHSIATVLERRGGTAVCGVRITTGRPHQIRIHLAAAGHPLVGDPLYGPGGRPLPGTTARPGDLGYLLHAHRLAIEHPTTGEPLTLEARLPVELETA